MCWSLQRILVRKTATPTTSFLWELHVILIGWLVKRIDVLHLAIGQYFLCGLFSVTAGIVFKTQTLSNFSGTW